MHVNRKARPVVEGKHDKSWNDHRYNFVLNEWTKNFQKYKDRLTKSEQTAKHDLVCKPFTPPRSLEISGKNWSAKVKPFSNQPEDSVFFKSS